MWGVNMQKEKLSETPAKEKVPKVRKNSRISVTEQEDLMEVRAGG